MQMFGVARVRESAPITRIVSSRRRTFWPLLTGVVVLLAGIPSPVGARPVKPVIKSAEVGYFGSAVVTHQFSVFVYLTQGPSAGNRVTVCVSGVCERAHGHNARLAWYSASFKVRPGFHMGDLVKFSAVASNSAGSSRISVADPLLCMHNDGSTPQR
jgi:hypothetical protein